MPSEWKDQSARAEMKARDRLIGMNIRRARVEKGYGVVATSKACGWASTCGLLRVERGEVAVTASRLVRVSKVLGVSVESLLKEDVR